MIKTSHQLLKRLPLVLRPYAYQTLSMNKPLVYDFLSYGQRKMCEVTVTIKL